MLDRWDHGDYCDEADDDAYSQQAAGCLGGHRMHSSSMLLVNRSNGTDGIPLV